MRFELKIDPLDLDQTLGCGQTFRWQRQPDGSWRGPIGDQIVRLAQTRSRLIVEAFPGTCRVRGQVAAYLRAGDDIRRIQSWLAKDHVLAEGMKEVRGLRIVKMDEWECLVSYVLATYANIPRITKMIETLSVRYGDEILDGVHAFPAHAQLCEVPTAELTRCGFGYRADYLHRLCKMIDDDRIRDMRRMPYPELREELKELPGVGDKVADCVSLFGFGKLEAFPIDVWIERALARLYKRRGSYSKLRAFAESRFGPYAGYAQEYLYYNERLRAPEGACVFSKD